jgi:hypothetical protein
VLGQERFSRRKALLHDIIPDRTSPHLAPGIAGPGAGAVPDAGPLSPASPWHSVGIALLQHPDLHRRRYSSHPGQAGKDRATRRPAARDRDLAVHQSQDQGPPQFVPVRHGPTVRRRDGLGRPSGNAGHGVAHRQAGRVPVRAVAADPLVRTGRHAAGQVSVARAVVHAHLGSRRRAGLAGFRLGRRTAQGNHLADLPHTARTVRGGRRRDDHRSLDGPQGERAGRPGRGRDRDRGTAAVAHEDRADWAHRGSRRRWTQP